MSAQQYVKAVELLDVTLPKLPPSWLLRIEDRDELSWGYRLKAAAIRKAGMCISRNDEMEAIFSAYLVGLPFDMYVKNVRSGDIFPCVDDLILICSDAYEGNHDGGKTDVADMWRKRGAMLVEAVLHSAPLGYLIPRQVMPKFGDVYWNDDGEILGCVTRPLPATNTPAVPAPVP